MTRAWYIAVRDSETEPWEKVPGTGYYSRAPNVIDALVKIQRGSERYYTVLAREEKEGIVSSWD